MAQVEEGKKEWGIARQVRYPGGIELKDFFFGGGCGSGNGEGGGPRERKTASFQMWHQTWQRPESTFCGQTKGYRQGMSPLLGCETASVSARKALCWERCWETYWYDTLRDTDAMSNVGFRTLTPMWGYHLPRLVGAKHVATMLHTL